jgi:hypothetical protein
LLKAIIQLRKSHDLTQIAGAINQVDKQAIIDCTARGLQTARVGGSGLCWEEQQATAKRPKRAHRLENVAIVNGGHILEF